MKQTMLVLAALAGSLLAAAPSIGQEVRYWGLWQGTERGLIQLQGQYYTVGQGDEIPGLGSVQEVTAESLAVRRSLTAAEQRGLAEQGRVVPDVETRHIPNLTNRIAPPLTQGVPRPR
jgi:hypothetical protein